MALTIGDVGTTLLNLHGPGVPPYSARGLNQTLDPIDQASQIERSINGEPIDFGYTAFQKYKSNITGADVQPPACDGVWPGQLVEVDCIPELCVQSYDDVMGRTAVIGSIRQESEFTFYRPKLSMIVISFTMSKDEYGATTSWSMQLEEV